jgi:hypothetical protein
MKYILSSVFILSLLLPVWGATPANVLYFNGISTTPIAFENLKSFAVEVSLAQRLSRQYPDDRIIMVKYAVGGTGIAQWQPPAKPLMATVQAELAARAEAVKKAVAAGEPIPPAPKIVGLYKTLLTAVVNVRNQYPEAQPQAFIWIQGESDGGRKENAEAYAERFKTLIAGIRRDIGVEKLPVILGSPYVKKEDKLLGTYNDIVREQQKSAAEADPTVHLIDIKPLNPTGAGHYSAKANLELGGLMADEFIKIQAGCEPVVKAQDAG